VDRDHHRLLVMDGTRMITTTIVVTTLVNESENGIKIEIGIDDLLPRVGRLLRLRLLVGRDRGTDLQCRILNRDEMRPCMRDEMKRYMEEGGRERDHGYERRRAKRFKVL
jgi:hypothetical protein